MRPISNVTAAIAVCLLIPLIAACTRRANEQNHFSLPQLPLKVHGTLLIAAGGDSSRSPATMALICTTTRQLHLLERTRLPGPHDELKVPWTYRATMIIDNDLSRELELDAKLIALGDLDTILTPPLSSEQLDRLARIFGPAIPKRVSFAGVSESYLSLTGKTRGADIQEFTTKCAGIGDGG